MTMALLDVSSLDVFYGQSQVIHDVSFTVDEGAVVSIIGANGAGKTSILDSIFNYTEWDGEIQVDGTDVRDLASSDVARLGVSYCMEEHNLFPYMSVKENLLMGANVSRDDIESNLGEVYGLFPKLEERAGQRAKTLSGGEQQMLAIGKALMADPKLLILDEPTLGLAPVVIEDISDALETLGERLTILLVEQNVTFGFEHADEIILIETGNVVTRGTPSELEGDEYVQEAYLGLPST